MSSSIKSAWELHRYLSKQFPKQFRHFIHQECSHANNTCAWMEDATAWLFNKSEKEALQIMNNFLDIRFKYVLEEMAEEID